MNDAITPYLESKLIGTLFGRPYAAPGLWLGLCGPGGVELSGANYSRIDGRGKLSEGPPMTNAVKLVWPIALSPWGAMSEVYVYDAPTGGNQLLCGTVPPADVIPNRRVTIEPGALMFALRMAAFSLA